MSRRCFSLVVFLLSAIFFFFSPEKATAAQTTPDHPALGIFTAPLDPLLADDLGLPGNLQGLVVLGIQADSPAAKAGLREGEVIVAVKNAKGKKITVTTPAALTEVLNGLSLTKPVELTVFRAGQEVACSLPAAAGPFGPILQPSPAATPRVIVVAADGTADYKTPTGAVFHARPGDTILIKKGLYGGLYICRDRLTIGPYDPEERPTLAAVSVRGAKGVVLRQLLVVADPPVPGYGIAAEEVEGLSVLACYVKGFSLGLRLMRAKEATVEGNVITGNVGGIAVYGGSTARVAYNLIGGNALTEAKLQLGGAGFSGGVEVAYAQAEIVNNTIIANRVNADNFATMLNENRFSPPGVGIILNNAGRCMVFNNIVAFNNIGILADPVEHTIEYNDVYGQVIEARTWQPKFAVECQVKGGSSNFLREIRYEYIFSGAFSFEPHRSIYTPVPFQPSPTNLSLDPLFADPIKGDYRLAPDSPLATKGRNGSYIGAFPPVGKPDESPAASPTPTPSPPPTKEQLAVLRGRILSLDPEILDVLLARLRGKLAAEAAQAPLGLVPFSLLEMTGISLSGDFMENLTTAAVNAGFQIADQGRLAAVLREMGIDDPGQMGLAAARELAERTGCRLLLLGSIADRGETVLINVRLLEAATGKYLAAERLEVKKMVKN